MFGRRVGIVLSVALSGCAPQVAREDAASLGRCEWYDVPPDPQGRIVDTEDTINPTDGQRTERALAILHDFVMRYRQERGRLPDSLSAILQLGPPADLPVEVLRPQARWLVDAWGQPMQFSREGERYKLASAGPDRRIGTSDDVITFGPCTGSGNTIRLRD